MYNEKLLERGKKIYNQLLEFVKQNKGNDDKYFKEAYIRLKDERVIKVSFDENPTVTCSSFYWSSKINDLRSCGFTLVSNSKTGFTVDAFCREGLKASNIKVTDKSVEQDEELTENELKYYEDFFDELEEAIKTAEYSTELTHIRQNLNIESFRNVRKALYVEEVKKLEPGQTAIPSVRAASTYVVNSIMQIQRDNNRLLKRIANLFKKGGYQTKQAPFTEIDLLKFEESLQERLMNALKDGSPAYIELDDFPKGLVYEALNDAHIPYNCVPTWNMIYVTPTEVSDYGRVIYHKDFELDQYLDKEKSLELK